MQSNRVTDPVSEPPLMDKIYQAERSPIILIIWVTVIVIAGIWPFENFVGHAHWQYIKWFPTVEDLTSWKYLLDIGVDIVGNVALFFPFGYLLAHLLANRTFTHQLFVAATLGGVLAIGIEYYQVYCHNRFPSLIDVITNVTGSLLGVRFSGSKTLLHLTRRIGIS